MKFFLRQIGAVCRYLVAIVFDAIMYLLGIIFTIPALIFRKWCRSNYNRWYARWLWFFLNDSGGDYDEELAHIKAEKFFMLKYRWFAMYHWTALRNSHYNWRNTYMTMNPSGDNGDFEVLDLGSIYKHKVHGFVFNSKGRSHNWWRKADIEYISGFSNVGKVIDFDRSFFGNKIIWYSYKGKLYFSYTRVWQSIRGRIKERRYGMTLVVNSTNQKVYKCMYQLYFKPTI